MNWLIGTSLIGISAAIATTFDDNIYLTAFLAKLIIPSVLSILFWVNLLALQY